MYSLKNNLSGNFLKFFRYVCSTQTDNLKVLIMKYLLISIPFLLIYIFSCDVADNLHSASGEAGSEVRSMSGFPLLSVNPLTDNAYDWQGYTNTRGGNDGEVVRVTNLNNSGPGSFREAVAEVDGPRLVVFDVGGVIDLEEDRISIHNPFLTVAGQTAPSPGITLIKGDIHIRTHDVIIEHIAIRPGDAGHSKGSGWSPDGITTDRGQDVIIRNCSITWAIDEGLTASGPRDPTTSRRVSFINNIIAEGLDDSSHPKGPHSKGSLIHDYVKDIAIIGNLYAHNWDRNPEFKEHNIGVIVNNVIYNPGVRAMNVRHSSGSSASDNPENSQLSVVGNLLQWGPNTGKTDTDPNSETVRTVRLLRASSNDDGGEGDAFLDDNIAFNRDGGDVDIVNSGVNILDQKPTWPEGLIALPAADVKDYVLKTVGARPWDRSEIDQRIIQSVLNESGRVIDSQDEVGGYPDYEPVYRTLEVPDSNRDEWLQSLTTNCGGRPDCI